jgi:hypothetical protein
MLHNYPSLGWIQTPVASRIESGFRSGPYMAAFMNHIDMPVTNEAMIRLHGDDMLCHFWQKKARAEVCKSEAETQIVQSGVQKAQSEAQIVQSDAQKAQAEARKTQVETYVSCFETVARLGVVPDDRARLHLRDLVGSETGQVSQLQRKELSIRDFLLSKKVNPTVHESVFGKRVAKLKREDLRAKGLSEVLPTKLIESKGQVVSAKLYFEEDMPFFEAAWMNLRGGGCDSEVSNTLATAFMRSQAA